MTKGPKKNLRLGKEKLYNVITSPVLTEKSTKASEHNKVTFTVNLNASKPEIQKAVEDIFKVKVTAVNTLRVKGKTKRFRGILGQRSDRKKAIVTLAEGSSIDIASGL
ncbi:MAG: 50S ribosomal protein L23 [Alphaproteobacteria bacterium]|nr:50S ribosomal protein L23 [Alphaproteobacteria bacterium]